MYITAIRLIGLDTVEFPVTEARPTDPYIIKNADGLGPSEVDVSIQNTLNAGGYYQGRKTQLKEIVLQVGLNPNYNADENVSDLRTVLYGLLTPGAKDEVRIEILDFEDVLAYITGHVKKFEITPFSPTPEVQITISCIQQYWIDPELTNIDLSKLDKAAPVITNTGTAPTGFYMSILFTAAVSKWVLSTQTGLKMQFNYAFAAGDYLFFTTHPGERGIWLQSGSNGAVYNIIYALSSDSTWLMLHGGDNQFLTDSQTFDWEQVNFTPHYWGI